MGEAGGANSSIIDRSGFYYRPTAVSGRAPGRDVCCLSLVSFSFSLISETPAGPFGLLLLHVPHLFHLFSPGYTCLFTPVHLRKFLPKLRVGRTHLSSLPAHTCRPYLRRCSPRYKDSAGNFVSVSQNSPSETAEPGVFWSILKIRTTQDVLGSFLCSVPTAVIPGFRSKSRGVSRRISSDPGPLYHHSNLLYHHSNVQVCWNLQEKLLHSWRSRDRTSGGNVRRKPLPWLRPVAMATSSAPADEWEDVRGKIRFVTCPGTADVNGAKCQRNQASQIMVYPVQIRGLLPGIIGH
ncbi:hypothetical protein Bbelb_244160 [Branchiostoma belcheri]|nr:hypothetical protein Bbelb_244160 [Branchiostoma belcheri]